MKCGDCGGGTPAPDWKRCEDCALQHLRHMMSGGMVPVPAAPKRYARGDRVRVGGEVCRDGVVARSREGLYTVRLDDGTRCRVDASQLSQVNSS